MRIVECKVNHLENPLGFQLENPVFSWKVEDAAGKAQAAARILVAADEALTAPLADTGWQAELDSLAAPVALTLAPRTAYFWQVQVRSDAGEEAAGPVCRFETAKQDEPWQAQWIGAEDSPRHPVFSKAVPAAADAARARLYITGLGLYAPCWNGVPVTDERLLPYCNAYDRWLQYQTFDVTEQVRAGGVLSVTLGDGWYKGRFGFDNPEGKGFYGDSWKLLAELRITHADGSETVIGTDESWTRGDSAFTFSGIYDGEHRDDTLASGEPVSARRVEPPQGVLTARYSLPVRTQQELPVAQVIHTPAGETVLDLGQEITGGFRLRVREPRGAQLRLQFGEVLQGGSFYRDNLRTAKAEYRYVSSGEETVLEPVFTFYGYRYVKLEGFTAFTPEDFTGLAWWSQMDRTGVLETGVPEIDRLIQNTEWGHLDNFLDVPTDCPQRDERMGWTGDAEVFAPTACFQRDSYAFYRKYLYDMAQEQAKRDGAVPHVVPAFAVDGQACAWADATTIIPWRMYSVYGDRRILEEHFPAMQAWVDWITRYDGDNHAWGKAFHFGDWLALDGTGGVDGVKGGTDDGLVANVYYLYSAELVAKAAAVLGKAEEAARYTALAEKLRAYLAEEYYSPAGRCCVNTQTAQLLTLRFGLGPVPARAGDALVALLNENGGKLKTGFVGTPILAEELTKIGRSDMAYNLLFNEEYPGWLYEIKLGATTIWERWNSILPDGSISSTGMNSLNHYSYGSIVQWIYERAAGLRQDETVPGFRRVLFAPQVDYRLGRIACAYDSPAGRWESGWEILDEETLRVKLTVPFGCRALVTLPNSAEAPVELGTGSYEWTYASTVPLKKVLSCATPMAELLADAKVSAYLREHMPQVFQVPEPLRAAPLEALLRQSAGDAAEETIQSLNAAFAAL